MGTVDAPLERGNTGVLWTLLAHVSGYLAIARGSMLIEPQDVIKAIYIVDLEHVARFWDDWEGFEEFVSKLPGSGASEGYVNRIDSLIHVQLAMKKKGSGLHILGRFSESVRKILAAAQKLASERVGAPRTLSSRDLLFCACSLDPELSRALQESGLQLDKLAAAVKTPRR
jgi:hypothetical protein